jgi:uncharacterized protein YdhG (YjbR/CyaY superfamily)
MAERKQTKSTRAPAKSSGAAKGFTAEEKAAMRARTQELKAAAGKAEGEKAVRAAIAAMPPSDRAMAERLHAIITETAPELSPKTWYGMPAYAKNDKVVCFFKNASKFKERYATLGFDTAASLDEGSMWPTSFALTKLTRADEAKIAALVKKAVS